MAWSNIDARRAAVAAALASTAHVPYRVRRFLAAQFGCSTGAIDADIVFLTRPSIEATGHCTAAVRRLVRERDGQRCRYCGATDPDREYVVEHVIPAALGGIAQPSNLVMACQSCNVRKGRRVWQPDS